MIREAERTVLIAGLKGKKTDYFITGGGDLILVHGFIDDLHQKYPDVTENSLH